MKTIINSLLIIIFICSISQAQENDFQTWYVADINKKIIKKTDFRLKIGLRVRENSSIIYKRFFDTKIKKELSKRVAISGGYRYSINDNKQFVSFNAHRFYTDISYKNKIKIHKRISYSIRNRIQNQFNINGASISIRQKFALAYNIRKTKLTPKIATEYFFKFNEGINKLRSTISFSLPALNKLDFDLAYRIQQEFFVNNSETLFIFEGRLSYNL